MKKFVFVCLLLAPVMGALSQAGKLTAQMDAMMEQYVKARNFSGVVMVSQKGRVLYGRAFGYANNERYVLNETRTNFNIASVGKTFTAVMIMQLVQEGKLQLTDTLSKLLPEYNIQNADKITVKHLLTHTSGINNYMAHPQFESKMRYLRSLADVMPLVADMPSTMAVPGERFDYSNSGFITLGRIIEKITGKDYQTNLEERIFSIAGISNSYIHYPATFNAPDEAMPYYVFSRITSKNAAAEEFPAFSDGGMQSNAVDLTNFANGLLLGKLLGKKYRDELWTGVASMGRGKYALGWMENENPYQKKIISHDGGGKGFSTDLKIVVDDEYVIVVLINNRQNPRDVSNNIVKLIYTGKYDKPVRPLEQVIFEKIEQSGWQAAKEQMLLNDIPSVWVYIRLMENLADAGKASIAFDVLELARKNFPNETGPFNVAAQISIANGDKTKARDYYEKALSVNPDDAFAKSGLKGLGD
ncbi:MAG TPA: serine hydrolase [Chitinophagaceae bacterium]|nr:serine hydrolase [Chitinophagaceae bacterium]